MCPRTASKRSRRRQPARQHRTRHRAETAAPRPYPTIAPDRATNPATDPRKRSNAPNAAAQLTALEKINSPTRAFPSPSTKARAAGQAPSIIAAGPITENTASRPIAPSAFNNALAKTRTLDKITTTASHGIMRLAPCAESRQRRDRPRPNKIMPAATTPVPAPNTHSTVRTYSVCSTPASALAPRTSAVCPLPVAPTTAACRTCCNVVSVANAAGPPTAASNLGRDRAQEPAGQRPQSALAHRANHGSVDPRARLRQQSRHGPQR